MAAASSLRSAKKRSNGLDRADNSGAKKACERRPEQFQAAPIPLLDLTRKYRSIETELRRQWGLAFESMRLLNGRNLAAFEEEFAAYCNVRYAVGVGSGTDAIFLSLRALAIGSGDEVILPAHAPAPVIEPIVYLGARPVLVDKSRADYGPDLTSLRGAITRKTKAVIAVHLLGLPCDMDAICQIANEAAVPVVEDSSQAQGALYHGKRAAGLGMITPMSLGPVKNLACYGDGGVVLTNDEVLAKTIRLLRAHGQSEKYNHKIYGWNSRLDELQAAVLRVKLPLLDRDNARRRNIAEAYTRELSDLPLKTPPLFEDRQGVYHQYVIETTYRDKLKQFLTARQIGTGIYYPVPLHRHEAWLNCGFRQLSCPEAERYANQNIALPMFAELRDDEVDSVIGAVKEFFSVHE